MHIFYDQFNSSHFDKLEHTYKFTKEILKAKNNLVYSTHFDSSERIRTFFQKFKKKSSSIMRHNFWWHCDASKSHYGFQIAEIHVFLRSK